METFPLPATHAILPGPVHRALWERITARLERGDSLITTRDFLDALSVEYEAITGETPSADLVGLSREAVLSYNREYPERFLAQGVQNSVTRAFQDGCFKLEWDVPRIESAGARSIARFTSHDRVRGFLKEFHLSPAVIRAEDCVRHAVAVANGSARPLTLTDRSTPVAPAEPVPASPVDNLGEEAVAALGDGTISVADVESHQAQQQESQQRLEEQELARAPQRVEHYVREGLLSKDEGDQVRSLAEIDRRLERGEIDEDEASRLRNSLLTKEQRFALEKKLKGAVDHAVRFLQAFEALQRIGTQADEALRFLIRHKLILDGERGTEQRRSAASELLDNRELLRAVVDVMDRKDQEIRMISVGLPPYTYVVKRNERIGNLIIDEDFVDDLRQVDAEEMSERLHSDDAQVRVRPAADIRCLIAIVNHLIRPTPWRKDVRLLRVQDTIEQFYHETENLDEARKQAESFLHRRLRRMFRDLSGDEKAEIEEQGAQMIDAIEERVRAEREAAAGSKSTMIEVASEDGDGLSDEEVRLGASIGRVEMRVAGSMRRVPRKIMRDPDDDDVFVLAQRNPDSGELEPVRRRGAKRTVERGTDGLWRLTSGA